MTLGKVGIRDLVDGDILLSKGLGISSGFLRLFGMSDYSHAAMYFDGHVLIVPEYAEDSGPVATCPKTFVGRLGETDVYRFISPDRKRLNNELPFQPIRHVIQEHKRGLRKIAYSETLSIALALTTRSSLEDLDFSLIRPFFEQAMSEIDAVNARSGEAVTSAEMICRWFGETEIKEYQIDVHPVVDLKARIQECDESSTFPKLASAFLKRYLLSKKRGARGPVLRRAGLTCASPTFAMPADIALSPSTIRVGALAV